MKGTVAELLQRRTDLLLVKRVLAVLWGISLSLVISNAAQITVYKQDIKAQNVIINQQGFELKKIRLIFHNAPSVT